MSKSAAYQALGEGLMFGAAQWQQNRAQTAKQRREEALARMRHEYNTSEQDRQYMLDRDLGSLEFQRERQAEDRDWERGSDKREAELESERALAEQRRASAQASEARAGYYERPSGGGSGGSGIDLTALEKEIPLRFRQDALERASEQAGQYLRAYEGDPMSVDSLLELHGSLAEKAGVTQETPLNEAYGMIQEAIYRDQLERFSGDFSTPDRGRSMGGNSNPSSPGGGLMEEAGRQAPGQERSPYPDGTRLKGPDGKIYVVRDGQPVLEQ